MATSGTRDIISAAMKADPTVTNEVRKDVLRLLDGKANAGLTDTRPMDRALTRDEVARLMRVKPRTVTYYARRGLIRPLRYGEKGLRAMGYSEKSVREAMERGLTATDAA